MTVEEDRERAENGLNRLRGGPAFPIHMALNAPAVANPGMSLRDWFAGMALSSLAHLYRFEYMSEGGALNCAARSYAIADAMLQQRDRDQE